jgi:hypothetical protein
MKIILEFEYRDLTDNELIHLLFQLQANAQGKIYSITKKELEK